MFVLCAPSNPQPHPQWDSNVSLRGHDTANGKTEEMKLFCYITGAFLLQHLMFV